MMSSAWWEKGIQFQCQGSGKCCTSRGEYGFVFLTLSDRQQMAKLLGLTTQQFTAKYCDKTQGYFHLKEDPNDVNCMFLDKNRCEVYEARPTQCRTRPFWPEVMNAKDWKKDVIEFCPGVGKGPVIPKDVIEKNLKLQTISEKNLAKERR